MLTHIAIRDFAIIDSLELELGAGMSVLTGETGAGKSILVDALGLVLGDRADATVIRHGAERAEITLECDLRALPAVRGWLEARELASGEDCILRRTVSRDGRSRGQINGHSVPLTLLRELGEQLVDIHGQHEHQSLLRPAVQRVLLDSYGGHETLCAEVACLHGDWRQRHEQWQQLRAAAANREARLEVLRYQVAEIGALALRPGESAELEAEHRRLAHGSRLAEGAQTALAALYENEHGAAYQTVHRALASLTPLAELDPRLKSACEALAAAEVQIAEASDALRRYGAHLDLDPQRLAQVENRLASLHEVARKHRVEPEALPELFIALSEELRQLENADSNARELEAELARLRATYERVAGALHDRRLRAAADLGGKVTAAMQELGMPGGRFAIVVQADSGRFTANGMDEVEFQVSANPGQPLKPLAKVASGGELSRIALAIQVIAAQASAIPAMVFDEVDAGIGGGVAEIVGRRLRALGEKRQVLCVTHLPQVASQAHRHLRVSKETRGQSTLARIAVLDAAARIEELARMLGGVRITETTRNHAREMMARAGEA